MESSVQEFSETRDGWSEFELVPAALSKRSAAWRATAERHRVALYDDLVRLELETETKRREREYLIKVLLSQAGEAISGEGINLRTSLSKWWWGSEVERAWALLREVEERTIDLVPTDELSVYAVNVSATGHHHLGDGDERVAHLDMLRVEQAMDESLAAKQERALRAATVQVLRKAHGAIDRLNREARYLRNRILIASILGVIFGIVVVVTQWEVDDPFLATPQNEGGSALTDPSWRYVLVVMTWGAVGALLTAIPAMTKTPADFGPFNLPLQQSMLKIVLGPLAAIVGFAILSEEPFGASPPSQWPGVMLLAIAFGAGQQAVTRYVDQRAERILSAAAPAHTRVH